MGHAKTYCCCTGVLVSELQPKILICLIDDPSDKATGNLLYCCYMTIRIRGVCWVTEFIVLL